VWQYFVYNKQTGKSLCQIETGRSDDEEEAGPSMKVCAQEVAGKFPTNLKQHLKKYHALQYEEVVKLEVEENKKGERKKKEMKGELVKGQAMLQQAFAGQSAYGKNSDCYRFLSKKLALFIACTNLSILLVENDELRGLIAALDPRYEVPSRTLATKHLDALMEELKGSIQQHLLAAQRISL